MHYSGTSVICSRVVQDDVITVPWSLGATLAAGAFMALAGTGARAASDVDVGGFHDRALATTQQDLVGAAPAHGG